MSFAYEQPTKLSLKRPALAFLLAVAIGPSTTVMAQSSSAASASQESISEDSTDNENETTETQNENAVETIFITSTRRKTNLQLTPSSISAISGTYLDDLGKTDIQSFVDSVPGVTLSAEGGGRNRVVFRNISTSSQESGSPSSAAYFNDFPVSSAGGAPDIRLVDIDRVEVIKGPQGTLFGRSAMGGIVRYIANEPNVAKLEGGFNSYYSNTADGGTNIGGSGYINLPVSDSLAIRLVAYSYQNDGFIDNIELGINDFNDEDVVGGRFALKWYLTDKLAFDFTYLTQTLDGSLSSVSTTRDPGDLNVAGDEGSDIPFDVNARTFIAGVLSKEKPSFDVFNLKLEHDADSFVTTLLATRAYNKRSFQFDDREFVDVRSGSIPGIGRPGTDTDTDTLEFRLVSTTEGFFDWIGGVYYENSDGLTLVNNTYLGPDTLLFGFFPLVDGTLAIDNETILKSSETAFYGELGLNFSDDTRLLFGYRRSDVKFNSVQTKADGFFNLLQGFNLLVDIPFKTQEDVNTYKFSLEHRFDDDLFGYALASSGYRRGGFNQPTAVSAFSTFDSDSLWNYELGFKKTWMDGHLVSNVSAYYIDWKDMQLVTQDPITFARETKNVGQSSVKGVEFDLEYVANENWRFSFGGTVSDSKLEEDVLDPITGDPIVAGRKGDRLPGSAKESFFFTGKYAQTINGDIDLFSNLSYRYVGNRLNDFADVKLSSYSLTDFRIGLNHSNGWSAALFVDNVFDEAITYFIDRQGPTFERVPTNRPRTLGVNVYYNF